MKLQKIYTSFFILVFTQTIFAIEDKDCGQNDSIIITADSIISKCGSIERKTSISNQISPQLTYATLKKHCLKMQNGIIDNKIKNKTDDNCHNSMPIKLIKSVYRHFKHIIMKFEVFDKIAHGGFSYSEYSKNKTNKMADISSFDKINNKTFSAFYNDFCKNSIDYKLNFIEKKPSIENIKKEKSNTALNMLPSSQQRETTANAEKKKEEQGSTGPQSHEETKNLIPQQEKPSNTEAIVPVSSPSLLKPEQEQTSKNTELQNQEKIIMTTIPDKQKEDEENSKKSIIVLNIVPSSSDVNAKGEEGTTQKVTLAPSPIILENKKEDSVKEEQKKEASPEKEKTQETENIIIIFSNDSNKTLPKAISSSSEEQKKAVQEHNEYSDIEKNTVSQNKDEFKKSFSRQRKNTNTNQHTYPERKKKKLKNNKSDDPTTKSSH